jgi:hypothetical protein
LHVERDRLVEVGNGAVGVALEGKDDATVVESIRVVRIELDRLRQVRERAIIFTLTGIGISAAIESQRNLRI